jgi:hypothetical protein
LLSLSNVRVPALHRPALRLVAELSDDALARLQRALGADGTAASSADLVTRLRKEVPELDSVGADIFISMLFSIIGLHTTHSWSFEDLANSLSQSKDLDLEEAPRTVLATRLIEILGIKSLVTVAKAVDVAGEQSHVFHIARIVTDIRPVFGDDPESAPLGAVVVHTLVLEYHDVDGRIKSFYLGLSDTDLRMLDDALARAKSKSNTLRSFLDRAGLEHINAEIE